jgi:uncharacterized protein YbjT (DUF2867 family)
MKKRAKAALSGLCCLSGSSLTPKDPKAKDQFRCAVLRAASAARKFDFIFSVFSAAQTHVDVSDLLSI